jgi:hypothetical protein
MLRSLPGEDDGAANVSTLVLIVNASVGEPRRSARQATLVLIVSTSVDSVA